MKFRIDDMMKRMWTLLMCLYCCFTLSAQNISVKSFHSDATDLSARSNPVKNENAQNCALLKIITTETGLTFQPDAMGICKEVEYKTSEIWVWLSPGSRRLTIAHPQLGQLRNYEYPEAINASTVYVMELSTAKITTVVEEQNKENWLALSLNPKDAAVKIDGKLEVVQNGQLQKMYSVGEHTYEAFTELYYPQTGKFNISPDETTLLKIDLKPNFGYIEVSSAPENDAIVYINGKRVGTTPFTSGKLESKTYTVQVAKEMWQDASKEVKVTDNQPTKVTFTLAPNFAELVFTCSDGEAEIWINEEKKGRGRWTGRLSAGAYKIEAKREGHRTTVQSLTLKNGDKETITIDSPVPIYGGMNIITTPFGADIFLDGKKLGTTPKLLNNVLIGKHELKLQKEGYAPVTQTVMVKEGETITIEEKLSEKKEEGNCGTVKDYDGNVYNTVKIGQQCWMKENLRTTHYADGKTISLGTSTSTTTAYRYYPDDNSSKVSTYGYLYNWKAVMRNSSSSSANPSGVQGICPNGWHVPSDAEWTQLENYVSSQSQYVCGSDNSCIAKALASTTGWNSYTNTCAVGNSPSTNNATGFSAVPAGYFYGSYYYFGVNADFWSSTESGSTNAYYRDLDYGYADVDSSGSNKGNGFSVRCLRD